MPFDGVGLGLDDRVGKIDRVIDLLGTPERWCKGTLKTHDGRRCIRGAIMAVDGVGTLQPAVLRAINEVTGACMVLAGAGMCNAGRIVHHLKANLWKPSTHVLIVGYQGNGSLGRRLVDGATEVKIFGDTIAVKAKIHTLGGFSAHAGQTDLLHWFSVIAPCKPRVILTHGEDDQRGALAKMIQQKFRLPSKSPAMGEVIEL